MRADKKIGKIRKVEGAVARGVEGLGASRSRAPMTGSDPSSCFPTF
jgi:hypothetical protein